MYQANYTLGGNKSNVLLQDISNVSEGKHKTERSEVGWQDQAALNQS